MTDHSHAKHVHSPLKESVVVVLGGLLLITVLLLDSNGVLLAFAQSGPSITLLTPADNASFTVGDSITFSATLVGARSPFVVKLYVDGTEFDSRNVESGGTYSHPLSTETYSTGNHTWYITATNTGNTTSQSETRTFTLTSRSTETSSSSSSNENGRGSASGGRGGATGGPLGEKTLFGAPLRPEQRITLSFSRPEFHGVFKADVRARRMLMQNAIVVQPSLRNGLPPFSTIQKAFRIVSTHPWEAGSYQMVIEVGVPVTWLSQRGATAGDFRVWYYDTGKWKIIPLLDKGIQQHSGTEYQVYRTIGTPLGYYVTGLEGIQ